MLIANPIYDSVFKFLMEDLRIAKSILRLLTGEDILSLEIKPQEKTATSKKHLLTVYRLDFSAVIKTETGEEKKVLIELQKGKQPIDVLRFRRYLGENYSKPDEINGLRQSLPIITIYILGFPLSVKHALLKVNRVYHDLLNGEIITQKDEFIEKLTHDCYIVQIPFLPEKAKNKIEKILSVFNQQWVFSSQQPWLLRFPQDLNQIEDEDLKKVLERLSFAAQSEEVKAKIMIEEEIDNSIDEVLRVKDELILRKETELMEKEKELKEKGKELKEKGKELEKERKQKEALLKELEELKKKNKE